MEGDGLNAFPWRICLAGGWMDQPWVSKLHAGPCIVVNVHPHEEFKTRSGLATSTRKVGMKLWGTLAGGRPPKDVPPLELARLLFNCENPVDCEYVSGSQDACGLMLPGISRLFYNGGYFPEDVQTLSDAETVEWLTRVLYVIKLPMRPPGYDPLKVKQLTCEHAAMIARGGEFTWEGLRRRDSTLLGKGLSLTREGWARLLPETVPEYSRAWYQPYLEAPYKGCLFSGAGGGNLFVISDEETPALKRHAFKLSIKTTHWMGETEPAKL